MELRCDSRLHGRLSEVDGRPAVEVMCRSAFCGRTEGRVVLHYFDVTTGDLITTKRYKQPIPRGEESPDGLGSRTAVRHA